MIKDKKRQKRRQREFIVFSVLIVSLISLLVSYTYLVTKEKGVPFTLEAIFNPEKFMIENEAKFSTGNQIIVVTGSNENQGRIGLISSLNKERDESGQITYQIRFLSGEETVTIPENQLDLKETLYRIGSQVEVYDGTDIRKTVDGIREENGSYTYYLIDEATKESYTLQETELVNIIEVPLSEANTAEENNQLIQMAIDQSKDYIMSVLNFPEGEFTIGSNEREKDYILLSSNVEFRGNKTTLIVDGASRWLGFATGPTAYDGVSNVLMYGFDIRAKDLVNGNQFIVMLNHGSNWTVYNNTFTMVHAKSSHVFDLGGVINFVFVDNKFIGYAPDMTGKTEIGETDSDRHQIYAEAIQLDTSSDSVWDGGFISELDPNFGVNNQTKVATAYVTIARNQFLPYKNPNGEIVAYSATVGQHAQKVGPGIVIQNNSFVSQLANNFNINFNKDTVFRPVHAESDYSIILEPNSID